MVRLVAAATCASGCAYGLAATTAADIYTVAGTGTAGYSGNGGAATSAKLDQPWSVAVDGSGNLVIAEEGNDRLRMVAAASCPHACGYGRNTTTLGDIYLFGGNASQGAEGGDAGPATSATMDQPSGVAIDAQDDVLIADPDDSDVRMVAASTCSSGCPFGLSATTAGDMYPVAGTGATGSSGDGGPAASALLNAPYGVGVDSGGNLIIADQGGHRIRMVAASTCSSGCAYGYAPTTAGDIYTIAGTGASGSTGNGGVATSAKLNAPKQVAFDAAGDLLVADSGNHEIRMVANENCASACPWGLASLTEGDIYVAAGKGTTGFAGDGGPATSAKLSTPSGVAVDAAGNVLIGDTGNSRVRMVAAATCASACAYGLAATTIGDIYTIAGNGTAGYGGDGGAATSAELDGPSGLTLDANGEVLIADAGNNRVRMLASASCATSCAYGQTALTADDIYTIAGSFTVVNDEVGSAGEGGAAANAQLWGPTAVAVDGSDDVLIADSGNDEIREIVDGVLQWGTAPSMPALPALTLNGSAQTLSAKMNGFSVQDFTGSGGGWDVTVQGNSSASTSGCSRSTARTPRVGPTRVPATSRAAARCRRTRSPSTAPARASWPRTTAPARRRRCSAPPAAPWTRRARPRSPPRPPAPDRGRSRRAASAPRACRPRSRARSTRWPAARCTGWIWSGRWPADRRPATTAHPPPITALPRARTGCGRSARRALDGSLLMFSQPETDPVLRGAPAGPTIAASSYGSDPKEASMGMFGKMRNLTGSVPKKLLQDGLLGRGIITGVQQTSVSTGVDFNPAHVCVFTVEVTLDDVPRYTATCRQASWRPSCRS